MSSLKLHLFHVHIERHCSTIYLVAGKKEQDPKIKPVKLNKERGLFSIKIA